MFQWDVKKLPELADLSPDQRKVIEGTSALLAVWDWRTLISLPIFVGCIRASELLGIEDNTEILYLLVPILFLGVALFFILLTVRMHYHARRVVKGWKSVPEAVPPEKANDIELIDLTRSIAPWRILLNRVILVSGLLVLIASFHYRSFSAAFIGICVLYGAFPIIASYDVCPNCRQTLIQLGKKYNRCNMCGKPMPMED